MHACQQSPICAEIIDARGKEGMAILRADDKFCVPSSKVRNLACAHTPPGDQVTHALRVRVFPYPENVCSVWVMLVVSFRSIV